MARIKLLDIFFLFVFHTLGIFASTREEIKKLHKDISTLESRLGRVGKYYTSTLEMREATQYKSERLKEDLTEELESLNERKKKIQKAFMGLLINSLDKDKMPGNLAANDIMIKSLKKQKQDTEKHLKEIKALEKLLDETTARYREYLQTEKDLSSLLSELENQKSFLLKKQHLKRNLAFLLNRPFVLPLKNYSSIDYDKKGITLKFNEKLPLYSTGKGKVAYIGSLSTYGNVLMIDHGQDTRSILLGSFKSEVKKGQILKKYEPIGISDHRRSDRKIYFEVRKKNKVQNTILLIETDVLAQKGLSLQGPNNPKGIL